MSELSKRSREGYLLIDNRFAVENSPNPWPSEADLARARAAGHEFAGMTKPHYESATMTCNHCEVVTVLRPERTRPRGYCGPCDAYICDQCVIRQHLGDPCFPRLWKAEFLITQAERASAASKV